MPSRDSVRHVVREALPSSDEDSIVPKTGGRSNALYRVRRANGDDVVVRISLGSRIRFRRECALLESLQGTLPVRT